MKKFLISQKIFFDKNNQLCEGLEETYFIFFKKLNIDLIAVSNFKNNEFNPLDYDGLILSGSNDLSEDSFLDGYHSNDFFYMREKCESILLKNFIKFKKIVIGICHGMQYINQFFNGKIKANHCINVRSTKEKHPVSIIENPYIKSGIYQINHFHNHAIQNEHIGEELVPFVFDENLSTLEGFYHPNLPILGIQWHPERNHLNSFDNDPGYQIIKNFLNEVK
jgi:gamma-glutamyl-gamma-aminobutyrate hydrolase PuuD